MASFIPLIGQTERIFNVKTIVTTAFFGLAIAFSFGMLGSLKAVRLEDNSLIVSNYFREISVPLNEIALVNDPDMTSHQRIFVSFDSPTIFGKEIVFMPQIFKALSTSSMLRDRVDQAQKRREEVRV